MVGTKVRVYSGNTFKPFSIREMHLKRYFWEYSFTRRLTPIHNVHKTRAAVRRK